MRAVRSVQIPARERFPPIAVNNRSTTAPRNASRAPVPRITYRPQIGTRAFMIRNPIPSRAATSSAATTLENASPRLFSYLSKSMELRSVARRPR